MYLHDDWLSENRRDIWRSNEFKTSQATLLLSNWANRLLEYILYSMQ